MAYDYGAQYEDGFVFLIGFLQDLDWDKQSGLSSIFSHTSYIV